MPDITEQIQSLELILQSLKQQVEPTIPIGEAIENFERTYWEKHPRTRNRELSYQNDYGRPFRCLPLNERLANEPLKNCILAMTEPATRKRNRYVMAFSALLRHVGIKNDLTYLKGKTTPKKREIPTDERIIAYRNLFPSEEWRWAYGMIATFGLRPHEVFRLDCSDLSAPIPTVFVEEDSKTGSRIVYPMFENWIDLWGLRELKPPTRSAGDSNIYNGDLVTRAFRRASIPVAPYCLRHAYAIRAAVAGLAPSIVSRWMGHSITIHCSTYHRHLDRLQHDRAYAGALEALTSQQPLD